MTTVDPVKRQHYRDEVEDIYARAGVGLIYIEELPNGYCSDLCCINNPWFRVTSAIGHVVLGRRKRVISIDWKDSRIKKTGKELFPNEAVTRWETGIHAWNVREATKYIGVLHGEGGAGSERPADIAEAKRLLALPLEYCPPGGTAGRDLAERVKRLEAVAEKARKAMWNPYYRGNADTELRDALVALDLGDK